MVIITKVLNFREWEGYTHPFCLKPERVDRDVGELSSHYKKVGQMMHDTWNNLKL